MLDGVGLTCADDKKHCFGSYRFFCHQAEYKLPGKDGFLES